MRILKFLYRKLYVRYSLFFLFFVAAAWLGYFRVYGNFHTVDTNKVYRSAQLFSFNMPYYFEKYHIQSVINLRGASPKSAWYRDELELSKHYHVVHYDFGMGDREVMSMKQMNKLVTLIHKAPKPLLIHCKAGADRTSLASALYLFTSKQKERANDEISILYGHFPWLGSKTIAMDKSFEYYINHNNKQ